MTNEWINIGATKIFPENEAILVESKEFGSLVVVFQNGSYNILGGICTHEEFELGGAPVQEGQITCTLHMSSFDLKTGEVLSPPAEENLKVFTVKVENSNVFIRKN
jgi:3-phenylpropionate/trans-cinnamate dioxygenase ferredoxin subunit